MHKLAHHHQAEINKSPVIKRFIHRQITTLWPSLLYKKIYIFINKLTYINFFQVARGDDDGIA